MFENLLLVALVVIILWVIIIGLFLLISRRQPDVQAQIKEVEERLNQVENKAKR